ncbi:MAG: BamA/TamA family outer membrane protein [Bacteroidia bacterium]|nr:BamA/TamA family outer membrane protein [Bacteroidia bacterium]
MKKYIANKNIFSRGINLIFLFTALFIISCNPTKYVPQDETLLDEMHVIVNKEGIKKADLMPFVKQKPNKRIFGVKFHLGLYNLSNLNKQKWPHSWLREIGEEPMIFDPYATAKSREQIQSYIASKGYFDSQVMETIETANRKSKVYYNVDLKTPYIVRNLSYEIEDSTIRNLFYRDSFNCMIERGKPYDVNILQAELSRFERHVKEDGFYSFSGDHINFKIDSTLGKREVNIVYNIKKFQKVDANNRISLVPHSRYQVRNVYIYPDFVPKDALEGGEAYRQSLDTTFYEGYYFISPKNKPEIKYNLIIQSLYIKPGSLYNLTRTEQSQSHLLSLKTFRLVNIYYNEVPLPNVKDGGRMTLDCNIQLTLLSQQSFKVELEGTNSAGNLGGAVNLIYSHKNLFHGAELFNLKLKGAYEALSQKNTKLRSTQEYGVETSLRFPKFLVPFLNKEKFIKDYNPSTTLLAAYDWQNMPFYNRAMANATFGYTWNGNPFTTHIVNPIQANWVDLKSIDTAFYRRIQSSSYLAYSYRDIMIIGGNYSYIFSNQKIQKKKDYWFVRINAEAAGNLPAVASKILGRNKTAGSYQLLGQPFAQYVRADIDFRYNVIVNDVSSIVYRGFVGAGIPYWNSKAIPFEKQYFGGGANGIRAWQVRSLGPGSYVPEDKDFLNQTADIKIEANAEYRFNLFWILEGALFLDAGNIWSYNKDSTRPGAQFKFNKFYNDIAVGTGTGFRFDFGFVLMRADMGIKLRDPWIAEGSKWIMANRAYNFKNDFTIVVAIGYPF